MITIEGLEQIYNCSFMAKDGELVSIAAPVLDSTLRVTVKFMADSNKDGNLTWKTSEGVCNFIVTAWRNPLGTCTTEPQKFGEYRNRKLYFHLKQRLWGENLNEAQIYFLLGKADDQ